jgi:ABC-type uncharacterized transport system substrate-binding protein
MPQAGCLLSYAPNYRQMSRHTAEFIVRILKGESLANITIRQSTQLGVRCQP